VGGANLKLSGSSEKAIPQSVFVVPPNMAAGLRSLLDAHAVTPLDICVVSNPQEMSSRLRGLHAAYSGGGPNYICLIGNWSELPPARIPSPLDDDDEQFCLSDAVYGSASLDEPRIGDFAEGCTVGRIPTADIDVVNRLLCYERSSAVAPKAVHLAVSAECWADATLEIVKSQGGRGLLSRHVKAPVGHNFVAEQSILLAPQWGASDLVSMLNKWKRDEQTLLFNVHGSADNPDWVGESVDGEYVRILSPGQVQDFSGTILATEACYGGALSYDSPSVVEDFFSRGGLAFLGSSTIAYGSSSEQLSGADLMVRYFIEAIQAGESFGRAHLFARAKTLDGDPWEDDIARKTCLSFNLFGLPWM
jgi:hypothetical protein